MPNKYVCRHCEYFLNVCILENCAYPNILEAQEKRFPSKNDDEIEYAYMKHAVKCTFSRCKQAAIALVKV